MVILAGAILSGAFAPLSWWPLGLLAYAIAVRALARSRRPIVDSFLFGLTAHLLILSWSKTYVGVAPFVALALLQALFSIPLGLHVKMRAPLYLLPLTFLIAEWSRQRVPFGGFGWSNLGYSQASAPYSHLASIGGVYLISALMIAVVVARHALQWALVLGLLIPSLLLSNPSGGEELTAAAIQGGHVERTADFYTDIRKVFARHVNLTKSAPPVDVIVWPENVVDGSPVNREFSPIFSTLKGRELVIGATPMVKGSPENQSVHISETGKVKSIYRKQALVPFGEYVPFRSLVQHLNSHVDEVTDFRPGDELVLHSIKGKSIAALICFEIVDDSIVREAALRSAGVFSQTNSATFAKSAAARQQFEITRIRSIEFSRPFISASTVGITGFIDNNGRVIKSLDEGVQGALIGKIELSQHRTIYAQFPYLSLIFSLLFAAAGRLRRS